MANKVRVYGKAQNRTALGIVNAYMVMYPHASLNDLRQAFPDELNPDSGVKVNFKEADAQVGPSGWNGFFDKEEELITTGDGKRVALVSMWTKPSFERLVNHAAQYGIEIAQFDAAEKGFGKKGGYRLEYLNGYVPPVPGKKRSLAWLWVLLGLLAVAGIVLAIIFGGRKSEPKVVEVERVVTVVDTVYVQQMADLEKSFNAAQFAQGSSALTDDAKEVLFKVAELMKNQPNIKLHVEGHTSAEGDASANEKLSKERAQAVVDFLAGRGIEVSRLSSQGYGSSKPINPENTEAAENRRTEFIISE